MTKEEDSARRAQLEASEDVGYLAGRVIELEGVLRQIAEYAHVNPGAATAALARDFIDDDR